MLRWACNRQHWRSNLTERRQVLTGCCKALLAVARTLPTAGATFAFDGEPDKTWVWVRNLGNREVWACSPPRSPSDIDRRRHGSVPGLCKIQQREVHPPSPPKVVPSSENGPDSG